MIIMNLIHFLIFISTLGSIKLIMYTCSIINDGHTDKQAKAAVPAEIASSAGSTGCRTGALRIARQLPIHRTTLERETPRGADAVTAVTAVTACCGSEML